jgi:hypothetical protein
MSNIEYNDYPFYEVAEKAGELIRAGADVYQKFTCQKCGNRLTMEEPNIFYREGSCDNCGHITDIEKTGCNYLVHLGVGTTRNKENK